MEELNFIAYNSCFRDYARDNRKNQTKQEGIFWNMILKDKKFMGYKFTRQKPIGSFIIDFYCSKLLLGIEIDGGYHKERIEYDKIRDSMIYHKKILIVRFKNEEVDNDLRLIKKELEDIIQKRESDLHIK